MWLRSIRISLAGAFALLALALVWEGVRRGMNVPAYALPSLASVAHDFLNNFNQYLSGAGATAPIIAGSFLIAVILGSILGVISAEIPWLRVIMEPFVIFIQVVPKIAIAPLFLAWRMSGFGAVLIVASLVAFFPIYAGVFAALRRYPDEYALQAHLVGARPLRELFFSKLVLAVPFFASSARSAILLAAIGTVVGEFVLGTKGLGFRILEQSAKFDTPAAFGAILAVSALSAVAYFVVVIGTNSLLRVSGQEKMAETGL